MRKKNLGVKHVCMQCGCRFYDLGKSRPLCPKCGAEQAREPKRMAFAPSARPAVDGGFIIYPSPPKVRQKKVVHDEGWDVEESSFDEDDDSDTLGDGLSLIEEDDLSDDHEKDA